MYRLLPPVLHIDEKHPEAISRRAVMSTVGLVAQSAAKFITNWLSGIIGGPLLLGAVAVAMSTAQLLSLLGPTPLGAAASKYLGLAAGAADLDRSRASAAHLRGLSVLTTIPLSVAGALVWWRVYDGDALESVTVGLVVAGLSGYAVARGLFFGHRNIDTAGRWDLVTALTGVAGSGLLLALGVRSVVVLLPLALAWLLYTWAGWPRGARGRPVPELARDINGFTAFTTMGGLTSAGFVQASLLAAHNWGGQEGAGQYSAAFNLAAPLSIMVGAASQVLYPSMAEALGSGNRESFRNQLAWSTRVVLALMGLAIGALAVASPVVIAVVWGERFASAATILPVMLLGVLLTSVAVPAVNALSSESAKGARACAIYSLIGGVLGIAVWLAAAPSHGVIGVAAGYVVAAGTTALLSLLHASHLFGMPALALLARLAGGTAAVVTLVAWEARTSPGWQVVLACTSGFCICWALLSADLWRGALAWARARRSRP